ncbi:MAG: hypothetical protein JW725_02840 [Candidatus Babeliaceae bacterium]|nr:hypothetical protein [Candidatus Babeliaceae bacterium]
MAQYKKCGFYFQASVTKEETWFFVATLRCNEHLVFDRTLDPDAGLFEFYVPERSRDQFLALMLQYERMGLVSGLVEKPNRLCEPGAHL